MYICMYICINTYTCCTAMCGDAGGGGRDKREPTHDCTTVKKCQKQKLSFATDVGGGNGHKPKHGTNSIEFVYL